LKQRILSNFQGFQRPELTEGDLFSCKQKDKEPLQNYFRRFVHLRAQAPNVLDVVAIKAAIVGLRAGIFAHIESASRLLIVLVIMTMQFGRINAFNEMCVGFKVK
jgi:hypothetical protein